MIFVSAVQILLIAKCFESDPLHIYILFTKTFLLLSQKNESKEVLQTNARFIYRWVQGHDFSSYSNLHLYKRDLAELNSFLDIVFF